MAQSLGLAIFKQYGFLIYTFFTTIEIAMTIYRLNLCPLIVIGFLLSASVAWSAQPITVYSYHNKPPYILTPQGKNLSKDGGLYHAFVEYLNGQQDEYELTLEFMPRARLNSLLAQDALDGVVIGVNPLWFKDRPQIRYLWSDAFMQDKDVVIVGAGTNLNYGQPKDLYGRKMALSRGLYYWGVTEGVKSGDIQLYETDSDEQNLGMVALGRVDGTILSELTAEYFFSHVFQKSKFKILDTPHDAFARMLLFPQPFLTQFNVLQALIIKSATDPEWQNQLKKYQ